MTSDPNLLSALWRAWYFQGAPDSEMEIASLFLARLLTAAACLALPLVAYFSVYLTFNPLALLFPALVMVGIFLSQDSVALNPRTRMAIITGAIFLDAVISLASHETLLAGTAELLCAAHILVLSHGFRVATTVGGLMIGAFLVVLKWLDPAHLDASTTFHALTALLWLFIINLFLATIYGSTASLRIALANTNERLVLKLQGMQQVVASAADADGGTASANAGTDSATRPPGLSGRRHRPGASPTGHGAGNDGIEMFVWDDLFTRIQRGIDGLEPACKASVHFINNTDASEAYLADASRLSGIISRMVMNACARQRANNIWVTVESTSIAPHRHQVSLRIEDDGAPLCQDQLSMLSLDGALPAKTLPLSADIHLILVGRWLHELGVAPSIAQGATAGLSLGIEFTADVMARSAMTVQNMDIQEAPRSARVMVVDDDIAIRHTIQMLLKREFGVDVTMASSGLEALRLLGKEPVDLVITDYFMPGMDGAEMIS